MAFHVFKALESLDLSRNDIAGFVQNKGNKRLSWPSSLEVLDLSHNSLDNDIVSSFSDLKCLKQLMLNGNKLEGSLNISGNETLSWPSSLEVLDLTCNSLRNDAVSSFSDLKCLKQLKLNLNNFEGSLNISGGKHYIDIVLPITTFFLILFVGALLVYRYANKKVRLEEIASKNGDFFSIWNYDGKIAFEDIIQATEDFDLKYCIGTGGYGSVYRATLGQDCCTKETS
ncbi:hypothetical protein L6164_026223 [Bauhinia variegata]|uniref:Uncharacterized protein n=1 Tax=Bauhinia variegata TaxID=167791 RepID=A0ACB9LPG6_BAUVA|nr:hypothetical protein L6164_026223 [Bauhinia variegata]